MRTIDQIETLRKRARIPKRELCAAAGIHVETYRRIQLMKVSPTMRTMGNLDRSLERLTREAAQ